ATCMVQGAGRPSDADVAKRLLDWQREDDGIVAEDGRNEGGPVEFQPMSPRAALKETDARLTEHIKTVESHLDLVIAMFERHLREDHNRGRRDRSVARLNPSHSHPSNRCRRLVVRPQLGRSKNTWRRCSSASSSCLNRRSRGGSDRM